MATCFPAITPVSRVVVGDLGRLMPPVEKLLVHLLPVHCLVFPSTFADRDFADLGGNTMRLMAAWASVRSFGLHGGVRRFNCGAGDWLACRLQSCLLGRAAAKVAKAMLVGMTVIDWRIPAVVSGCRPQGEPGVGARHYFL